MKFTPDMPMPPAQRELAQLALTFLHRTDLKGIEALRLVQVMAWLENLARETERQDG